MMNIRVVFVFSAIFSVSLLTASHAGAQYYVYPYSPYGFVSSNGSISYGNSTWYNVWGNGPVSGETLPASDITATGVVLNGVVSGSEPLASYRFEYGVSPALGSGESGYSSIPVNTQTNVSYRLTGLQPNTQYFFRLVAHNNFGNGTDGQVLSFITEQAPLRRAAAAAYPTRGAGTGGGNWNAQVSPAAAVTPPGGTPIITNAYTPTTSYGLGARLRALFGASPSPCLTLSGQLSNKSISPGDAVSYTLSGKNNCSLDFANAVLTVSLPSEVQFVTSTALYSREESGAYVFTLGTFPQKSTLALTITGTARSDIQGTVSARLAALFDFTDGGTPERIGTYSDVAISPSFMTGLASMFSSFQGVRNVPSRVFFNFLALLFVAVAAMWILRRKRQAKRILAQGKIAR